MPVPRADFDTAWKRAIEIFLDPFFAFFFPIVHADIDWAQPQLFQPTELLAESQKTDERRGYVDLLVELARRSGPPLLVLVHIEVQNRQESGFAERIFRYHTRLRAKHHQQVATFVILADRSARWRPNGYRDDIWGTTVELRFPIVKLRDFIPHRAELEASQNPFAPIVLAHLTLYTTRQGAARRMAKFGIVRRLYEQGYTKDAIIHLFRSIDLILRLDVSEEQLFRTELRNFEKEQTVRILTGIEQLALEEGREEGREEILTLIGSIRDEATIHYGAAGKALVHELLERPTATRLSEFAAALRSGVSVEVLRTLIGPQ